MLERKQSLKESCFRWEILKCFWEPEASGRLSKGRAKAEGSSERKCNGVIGRDLAMLGAGQEAGCWGRGRKKFALLPKSPWKRTANSFGAQMGEGGEGHHRGDLSSLGYTGHRQVAVPV